MKIYTALKLTQSKSFQEWRAATRKAVVDMTDTAPVPDVLAIMRAEVNAMRTEQQPPAIPNQVSQANAIGTPARHPRSA